MPEERKQNPLPKGWVQARAAYDDHNEATKNDWDVSNARAWSEKNKAQYNPHHITRGAERHDLELFCIKYGTPITDLNQPATKGHRFYLDCRTYFGDKNIVVGYCKGKDAHFIMVKFDRHGFHGQPATWEYLRSQGAKNE